MNGFPHPIPATELRKGMQTFKHVEMPDGSMKLKGDVKLRERWDDTQGFVHVNWPHLSWKTTSGNIVVYSHGASVWVL